MRNGGPKRAEQVELGDRIVVATTKDGNGGVAGVERDYEVVGIVEDPDTSAHYAVGYNEPADEFIVTDASGQLVSDDDLAQDILNDYLADAGDSLEPEEEG